MEIKCQLDATEIFIADLIACSTCFGHHYAHHQELKSIIQWLLPVVFRTVVFSSSWSGVELRDMRPVCRMLQHPANRTHNPQLHTRPATWKNHSTKYHRQQPLYNTLELLMMGIEMPETCWASNKICNKKPLLHLVGILFPHKWSELYSEIFSYRKTVSSELEVRLSSEPCSLRAICFWRCCFRVSKKTYSLLEL